MVEHYNEWLLEENGRNCAMINSEVQEISLGYRYQIYGEVVTDMGDHWTLSQCD